MIQRVRSVALFWITIAATATAQTFDSSGNGMLKGDYFLRQVLLSGVSSTSTIARARSIVGTATFDGNGNYKFSGQMADTRWRSRNRIPSAASISWRRIDRKSVV